MPLLNIPHCGQRLTLRKECTVDILYHSSQTAGKLGVALGILTQSKDPYGRDVYTHIKTGHRVSYRDRAGIKTTLPEGTELEISQMYIRNKGWGDDSITFKVLSVPGVKVKGCRIVVSLPEANKLDADLHDMV